MSLTLTLVLAGLSLAVTLLCGWRGARAPDIVRGPRLIPWRFLMMVAGAVFVLMLVHLASLLGLAHRA